MERNGTETKSESERIIKQTSMSLFPNNQYDPTSKKEDIPTSITGLGLIPQLDAKNVEDYIKKFKKCSSRVNGDIPKELINPCANYLSKALTTIYNACMLTKCWPDFWKIETTVPIPKKYHLEALTTSIQ